MMILCLLQTAMICAAMDAFPTADHGLHYTEPAATWAEAFPLGNGVLGALVWGDGAPLNISLDRTDLWDLRPVPEYYSENYSYATMRQWEREGRYDELKALYDEPYHRPAPTKIPAGRIQIMLPAQQRFQEGFLNIKNGVAEMRFGSNVIIRVWVQQNRWV